jgi:hypothetical protein
MGGGLIATSRQRGRAPRGLRRRSSADEARPALPGRKVNVLVRDGNADGAAFWEALGYAAAPARQFGRELEG